MFLILCTFYVSSRCVSCVLSLVIWFASIGTFTSNNIKIQNNQKKWSTTTKETLKQSQFTRFNFSTRCEFCSDINQIYAIKMTDPQTRIGLAKKGPKIDHQSRYSMTFSNFQDIISFFFFMHKNDSYVHVYTLYQDRKTLRTCRWSVIE